MVTTVSSCKVHSAGNIFTIILINTSDVPDSGREIYLERVTSDEVNPRTERIKAAAEVVRFQLNHTPTQQGSKAQTGGRSKSERTAGVSILYICTVYIVHCF